jgi:hypothetical protein
VFDCVPYVQISGVSHVLPASPCPPCSCLAWQVVGTLPSGCALPRHRKAHNSTLWAPWIGGKGREQCQSWQSSLTSFGVGWAAAPRPLNQILTARW